MPKGELFFRVDVWNDNICCVSSFSPEIMVFSCGLTNDSGLLVKRTQAQKSNMNIVVLWSDNIKRTAKTNTNEIVLDILKILWMIELRVAE